ncbi:hypothetical protein Ga0080559_TMP3285 [Salipiger profundus]|uniref:Uncharacterized protein n=1 Tax=Salipiger profundus TaxID=1229727 RepID=A0A1U7D7E9_9RHOB|nr:hypothetical protein Ga0080559_TMP3285 [Salipiger profundus]
MRRREIIGPITNGFLAVAQTHPLRDLACQSLGTRGLLARYLQTRKHARRCSGQ